jgi:hypothetical protein
MIKKFLTLTAETISYYWKWALLPAYFFFVFMAWARREEIFEMLSIINDFPLYSYIEIAVYALLILIVIAGAVGILTFIRTPIILNFLLKQRFKKFGFCNAEGEFPIVLRKKKDRNKKHGEIYRFVNKGMSISIFERYVSQLEVALNGRIYAMDYGKSNTSITFVYVLPRKYDTPSIISCNDDFLIRDLINLLVVGKTGSGKSYALLVILCAIAKFKKDAGVSITICDYKKSSFAQFEDTPNFYGYHDVPDGIRNFYAEFQARLEANDPERNKMIRVLLIDEYGAMIAAQEKKEAEELKTMVANLMFMSRSLGLIVCIGVQRADSEHFKIGSRDQFKAIMGLSVISKEQKAMLFNDHKEQMTANNGLGEGYLLTDSGGLQRIKVASVRDMHSLHETIRQAMFH